MDSTTVTGTLRFTLTASLAMYESAFNPHNLTFLTHVSLNRGGVKIPRRLSQLVDKIATKVQRLNPRFGVQQSSGISADTVQPNRKWIIQEGGLETLNANSSAPRLDKYEIPTATATKLV